MRWHAASTAVLSTLLLALGVALLARAALAASPAGLVLGVLFVAVGAGRLYLLRR